MADNVAITAGSGTTVAADEVIDGTLGTVKVQYVKLMDGTLDGTTKATVNATGLKVDASGAAVPITDNAGSLTVDNGGTFAVQAAQSGAWSVSVSSAPTTTVTGTVTADTELPAAAALADATANPTTPTAGAAILGYNGTTWDRVRTANTGRLQVDVATAPTTTVTGTVTVTQATAANLKVDASGAAVPITDNAGSLTVDAPVGTPVFARLSDGAAALVGQKAMAASLPVTVASDQTSLPVTPASLTGTTKSSVVTVGTTAAALPATPLASRRTILVQSDSANTANIFLGGSGVTSGTGTTAGIVLKAGESMTLDASTALVYAISTAASQLVRVLEVS